MEQTRWVSAANDQPMPKLDGFQFHLGEQTSPDIPDFNDEHVRQGSFFLELLCFA
jgi:hypothetical protein